jgi:XRE family transcriptional regulator, regulator of sulfur utilization
MSNEALGRVIREAREERGLSQEGLAALADVSRTHIGDIERGAVSVSVEVLGRIARALGARASSLLATAEAQDGT